MTQHAATQVRPKIERDQKVPGLHIKHSARGSAWFLYYRTKDGQERRPKLGSTTVLNRTQAQKMAAEILLQVTKGDDPKKEALRQKGAGKTMQDLREEYDLMHGNVEIKASTKETYDILWDKHILPHFGKTTPVRSITKQDLVGLKRKLINKTVTYNRATKLLSHAMLLAEEWGWRDEQTNPCYRIKRFKEKKRKRVPTPEEMQRLTAALLQMKKRSPWFVGMILLLASTGCRKSEIQKAKREWFQGDKLMLPDSKTGTKIVALNSFAQRVVAEIPKVNDNPYLIVGRRPGAFLASPKEPWKRLRKASGIEDLNMHDLRRYFASVAISTGQTLEQAMQLLGHTEAQTTKDYAFLMTRERLAAMEAVGNAVMQVVEKNPGARPG